MCLIVLASISTRRSCGGAWLRTIDRFRTRSSSTVRRARERWTVAVRTSNAKHECNWHATLLKLAHCVWGCKTMHRHSDFAGDQPEAPKASSDLERQRVQKNSIKKVLKKVSQRCNVHGIWGQQFDEMKLFRVNIVPSGALKKGLAENHKSKDLTLNWVQDNGSFFCWNNAASDGCS